MRPRLLALLLAASSAAFGAGNEFDRLVKAVESHFGVRQTHIPLMGFASFVVSVARPEGARGFKIAIFEDLRAVGDDGALDRIMRRASEGLTPLVTVRSRRDGESTYIYASGEGKVTRMLIASFERREATIVEVRMDMRQLLRALDDPGSAAHALTSGARPSERRESLEP